MRRVAAVGLCLLATMAARPQCDYRETLVECAELNVNLEPGHCIELEIDCDTGWAQLGSFTVRDTFPDLWVEVDRRPAGNTVRLCAGPGMPVVVDEVMEYIDVRNDGAVAVGLLRLTTESPLE